MPRTANTLVSWAAVAAAAAISLCLAMACTARAADRIYWVNGNDLGEDTIGHANLAGGSGGKITLPGFGIRGLGIDAAAGKLYTLNEPNVPILSASLDGTGVAPLNTTGVPPGGEPDRMAVDPGGGKVYWTAVDTDAIFFANLRGGGGGALDTTGVTVREVGAVAVHPAAGRIYWGNGGTIAFASLNGGGGGILDLVNVSSQSVGGLAIDGSSNRIFWIDPVTETIEFASLGGGMISELDTGAAPINVPQGLAIDPGASRIYWANAPDDTIGFANLNGGGGGQLDTTGTTPSNPTGPVLLKTPSPASPPLVKGRSRAGATLSCESSWAADLPESFLYRAPQTVAYQWLRNGRPIAGATAQTVKARQAGGYACQATGTNAAGSASLTSATVSIKAALRLGKVRLNRATGTATLTVAALGGGKLRLSGAGIKPQTAPARAKARLRIRPSGRAKKRLEATGRVRVKAVVSFRPASGKQLKRSKKIVLKVRG